MANKKIYSVSLLFDSISAENPLEAAKQVCKFFLNNNGAEELIYDVEDEDTNEKFTVDLSEEDEDAVLPNKEDEQMHIKQYWYGRGIAAAREGKTEEYQPRK